MFTFAIDRGAFATFGWEDANEAGRSKSVDLERVPELRMCAALTSYPHERWGVVRAPFFALRPASYRRWPLLPPHEPEAVLVDDPDRLKTLIKRLRRSLSPYDGWIISERGVGYVLRSPD